MCSNNRCTFGSDLIQLQPHEGDWTSTSAWINLKLTMGLQHQPYVESSISTSFNFDLTMGLRLQLDDEISTSTSLKLNLKKPLPHNGISTSRREIEVGSRESQSISFILIKRTTEYRIKHFRNIIQETFPG